MAQGATFHHISVMRDAAIAALNAKPENIYVDATFGGGGYSQKILETKGAKLIAFDRDQSAIDNGQTLVQAAQGRLTLLHAPFSQLREKLSTLGISKIDGIVMDLGVSSPQIDEAGRGFSIRFEGPLDMRMDQSAGRTAAEIINKDDEETLATIFYIYGDERKSRAIARAIVLRRKEKLFTTTKDLADVVRSVVRPSKKDPSDPATRTFQALRIAVNEELDELKAVLAEALDLLAVGGRIVVVSFHSLEDRIAKIFFTEQSGKANSVSRYLPAQQAPQTRLKIITTKPVEADAEEVRKNPRARSAKMRVAEKVAA